MNSELSKQEYLKRYLEKSDGEKKLKKKKKISKSILPSVKIIHEDVDIKSLKFGTKEETDEEEGPAIAEVVDDRPVEIKAKEIYDSTRWKRLGEFDKECENSLSSRASCVKEGRSLVKNKVCDKIPDFGSETKIGKVSRRHDSDSDLSPPRKSSPERRKKLTKRGEKENQKNLFNEQSHTDSYLSPMRSNARCDMDSDSDLSPPRKDHCKNDYDSDLSPPRKDAGNASSVESHRPTKTLSGLKAGLQSASTLRLETKNLKRRERSQIEELDEELSGRNASTILRDKRSGQRRNLEAEKQIDEEKEKKLSEQQQKYAEWSKGISQSENKSQKLSEDLYEASKPFARYCDDKDLEETQKASKFFDDPMAPYILKKQQKTKTDFPVYNGPPPPPNRFGIPPGYRWDGVDRSNGFEKRYFEQKSNKQAVEKEAFMWSVQDM